VLLAVMSVLVFVLPLYQLGLGLRNLVNTVRAKATHPFRQHPAAALRPLRGCHARVVRTRPKHAPASWRFP
jgi:hypothetical protein